MNVVRLVAAAALVALAIVVVRGAALCAMPANGASAPQIPVLQSVLGGAYGPFDLKAASTGKTVVLYFFPQAFSSG